MSPEHEYWFPAKRHGWGWGVPSRWQGWAVLLAYVALLGLAALLARPDREPAVFAMLVSALSLGLVAVCWRKGEPPRWRWGKD